MRTSLASILLASAALTLSACGGDDEQSTAGGATPTPTQAAAPASTPGSTPAAESGGSGSGGSSGEGVDVKQGECADVENPPTKDTETPEPKGSLDASKRNLVTLETSCGTIVLELDAKTYPKTANAVATLVKNGYWDDTQFHRIMPGFVIQGGDPTGTGTGGPSWKVVEAPKQTETYPQGTLAMAKSGVDEPGTTQSQFFIMSGENGLDPQYAVAGKVVKGLDAVLAADKQGDPANPTGTPPLKPVVLFKATFKAE